MEEEKSISPKYKSSNNLSLLESVFYQVFYWGSVCYALHHFYLHSQANREILPLVHLSSNGPFQDQNDLEWSVFHPVLIEFTFYGFLHLILSQIIRHFIPQILLPFYVAFSMALLVKLLGTIGGILCATIPLVMFFALLTRSKVVIWLCWCSILITFNTQYFYRFLIIWLHDIPDGEYLASVIAAWVILRSLSFSLDSCDEEKTQRGSSPLSQLMTLLAYCLYFPLLLTGPYMPYSSFQEGMKKPVDSWNFGRILSFLLQIMRFYFWMLINNTLLYYFYAHCHHFSPILLVRMDYWTLGGYVYFLLIFFFIKYVVYYGLMATFAKEEGFEPPRHPMCVLLVHRFSDVWRYFDNGLYLFMTRHIYIPFMGQDKGLIRKTQATVVVFIFVYVWHGASPHVFWWSLWNFIGILSENVCKTVCKQRWCLSLQAHISERNQRRLLASLCSFTLLLSVVSMVIFLSSITNANLVFRRIFFDGFPVTTAMSLFVFYSLAQCAIDVDRWRKDQTQKSAKVS